MSTFQSIFEPFDRVIIDEDRSMVGVVTCFQFRPTSDGGTNQVIEVSYVHNGDVKVAWIEMTRLTRVETKG